MTTLRDMLGRENFPSQIRPQMIVWTVIAILGLVAIFTMFFQVQPEEVALVLRFGKYNRQVDPGLNFKLPWPIEQAIKVPAQRQLKAEFGFRTRRADIRTQYTAQDLEGESLMLTGDLNVATVEWITQYRIGDPYKFVFKVRNVVSTFRDMNETVMRTVIGDRSVTEVLTVGRQEVAAAVEQRLQELCDQYETGIRVEQIVLQDVTPPDEVKPSFNEVNQAQQERERMVNDARTEFNKLVPRARGEAEQMISEAEGYATDRVNRATGNAAAFEAVLAAYKRAPEVTRRRIYLETMQSVLPGVKRLIVLDEDLKGLLPLLTIGGEVKP